MKSREFVPVRRRGASRVSGLALLVVAAGGVGLMILRSGANRDADQGNLPVDRVAASDTTKRAAPTVEQAVGAFRVRDTTGAIVPLVTKGEPAILMISSITCGWCKKSLKDLGELSAGRPLPRLKLLTLEGAAGGQAMLAKEHITGA